MHYIVPSSHPSRPSFETLEDMTKDLMEATGKDYKTCRRKVRIVSHRPLFALILMFDQALARDGFRCTITGMINDMSLERVRPCGILRNAIAPARPQFTHGAF